MKKHWLARGIMTLGCMTKAFNALSHEPFTDGLLYRSTNGALQHICVPRPYIQFVVNMLSQFMQTPILLHWKVVLRILWYLKATISHDLLFKTTGSLTPNTATLVSCSDADSGGDASDRRSISGHYLLLNRNPVVRSSKKQPVVATTSGEA